MERLRPLASLRYRFTLVMLAASLSFGLAVTVISWVEGRRALEAHTRQAASATLEAFARPAADRLLTEDSLRLRELMTGMLSTNERWVRVTVTDGHGRLRAQVPDASTLGPGDLDGTLEVQTVLLDPSVGVMSALVSNDADLFAAGTLVYRLGGALLVLTLVGLGTAWLLGTWLTRDLARLVGLVDRLGEGEVGVTLPESAGHDEVAVLARALNRASRRLGEARTALATQQAHLVETEKRAAVGSLAAGVAHEVANPVGGAMNCLQRLGRPALPPARRETYRKMALEATERAATVLQGLLQIARGARSGARLTPEQTTVADVVEQPTRMAGLRRGATVSVADAEDVSVCWPRGPVEQIVTNLLLNAVEAARSLVELRWARDGDDVVIEIADDGPGLPADLKERVFEPFFSTRPPGQGTGLGLPVARSIARSLGGDVSLTSARPGGTVARLRLPVEVSEDSHAA